MKGLDHDLTREQWERVVYVWEGRCAYCLVQGKPGVFDGVTIEHVVPIARGGGHTVKNVVPACNDHNFVKNGLGLDTILTPEEEQTFLQECAARLRAWEATTVGARIQFPERPKKAMRKRQPNMKLTREKAEEIRVRYEAGDVSQQALADEYGVCQKNVSRIVRGLSWC